ncbi:hypothetical protein Tco_1108797 [Tanacetum coccineum]
MLNQLIATRVAEALAAAVVTHSASTQEENNLGSNSQNKTCNYKEFRVVMHENFRGTEGVGLRRSSSQVQILPPSLSSHHLPTSSDHGGKLRGHIPGVGPVMPGYVRFRLSYTAPVDRSRDVDFMMNLMRSDNRFADAFARYDSGGASGSGGSRARDSDDTGGEDSGDDTS